MEPILAATWSALYGGATEHVNTHTYALHCPYNIIHKSLTISFAQVGCSESKRKQ